MLRLSTDTIFSSGAMAIDQRQTEMLATQLQLSTGKRINSPADDPSGASTVATLGDSVGQLGQFASNQSQATSLLNQGQSTLQQFNNALQSARQVLVQAGDGSYTDSERSDLAASLQGLLEQMMTLANTGDGNGGYLFAGSKQGAAPFTQTGSTFNYQGDSMAPAVEVATGRSMQTKATGDSVFMNIPQGNGSFVTAAGNGNTGSGVIDPGAVTNPSLLTGDHYTIAFAAGGSAGTYTVTDTTLGTTVASGNYADPTTLSFGGMSINISGAPGQSTLQQFNNALQTPTSGNSQAAAQFTTTRLAAMASFDQAMNHVSIVQAGYGSKINSLAAFGQVNTEQTTSAKSRLSTVQDVDYAKAATALSEQQMSYQAALQSYSMVSKLSLFNYL
jgi:flagellar hook-associated protein 3 FlgL